MASHDWEAIKEMFSAAVLLTGAAREEYIPARNIVTDDGSRMSQDSVTEAPNP